MKAVEKMGMDCGLQIHWGKAHFVPVCTEADIKTTSGDIIKREASMLFLDSTVHADGKFGCKISWKLGIANAEYNSLRQVWTSSLPMNRKVYLFEALIISKLSYGVASARLAEADLRRMDVFQASCLRKMLRIKPSFISRVSNATVRELARQPPLSQLIRTSQLKLMHKVLNNQQKLELRRAAFHRHTMTSTTDAFVRRIGRPRQNWTEEILKAYNAEKP